MRSIQSRIRILARHYLLSSLILALLLPALNSQAAGQAAKLNIAQVNPAEITQGSSATLTITGSGFSQGCYVSFSSPVVRVLSTKFGNESQLQADVEVGAKAATGVVTLFVANTEGLSAQIAFTIVAATSPPANAAGPAATTGPVISNVSPASAAAGAEAVIKVKGKGFVKGASVSFSNPGIEVLDTNVSKATDLSAKIRIAPNANAGSGGLFVVNPDESEAQSTFSVSAGAGSAAAASSNAKSGSVAAASAQNFNVINLGDAISVLHKSGKPQGTLVLSGNQLEYDEQGKKVFSVPLSGIQEIAGNVFFGINTGTFHIILNSGKTYNFIAASLSPQATQAMLTSLQRALR